MEPASVIQLSIWVHLSKSEHRDFITHFKVWPLDPLKIGLCILLPSWGPWTRLGELLPAGWLA